MFEAGMLYVALSRCKSLDGLRLTNFNADPTLEMCAYDECVTKFERTLIEASAARANHAKQ